MSKLHDICKEYDFCTPETRAELQANGFDFSVCKFGITEFIAARMQTDYDVETKGLIPYPTFTEVWRLLPSIWHNKEEYCCILYQTSIDYEGMENELILENKGKDMFVSIGNENICESACQLWLKLKKGGFLND